MAIRSDTETADRLGRRRARVTIVMAIYFIAGQALYLSNRPHDPMRLVDQVKLSAWLVWAVALMALLAAGGGWLRTRSVRALLNDEVAQANRATAFMWGFWAAMLIAITLYFTTLFAPLDAREAIHVILTAGVGTALLRFGMLERRALQDG